MRSFRLHGLLAVVAGPFRPLGVAADRAPQGDGDVPNPWKGSDSDPAGKPAAGIEDILRRRGGGWLPGGDRPDPTQLARLAKVALALGLLGGIAASSLHMLDESEEGLVTTLGRYDRTIGPGVSLTWPWPLQQVQVRKTAEIAPMAFPEKGGEAMLLTRDQFMVNLAWQLRWKVRDLRAFSFRMGDPEGALRRLGEAQMRAAVAEVAFDDLWDGSSQGAVQDRVRQRLQALLDGYGMGIVVEGVEVVRADPPARLADAFQRVREVRDEARKDQNTARKFAEQTLTKAQVEAAEFDKAYAEYKTAPAITRQRIYYETMEKVLANNPKVVIAADGANVTVPAPTATPAPAAAAGTK